MSKIRKSCEKKKSECRMSRNWCRWNFDLSIPYCQTRITQEIEFLRNRPNSSQCLISVFGVYLILSFCVRSSRWYNIAKMNCDDYRWHNIVDGTFADKLQTSTPVEHPTFWSWYCRSYNVKFEVARGFIFWFETLACWVKKLRENMTLRWKFRQMQILYGKIF